MTPHAFCDKCKAIKTLGEPHVCAMTPDQDKQIQDAAENYSNDKQVERFRSNISTISLSMIEKKAFLAGAKFAQARIDQLEGALESFSRYRGYMDHQDEMLVLQALGRKE